MAISGVLGFASMAEKWVQIIALIVGVLLYLFGLTAPFIEGGFIGRSSGAAVLASGVTGAIILIIHIIYLARNAPLELWAVFAYAAVWIAAYGVAHIILAQRSVSALTLLNRIEEDPNFFALLKSPNSWAYHACIGFAAGHEVCLDWRLFKRAIEFWPNSPLVWYAYAKFLAIYPSENDELVFVYKTVIGRRLHGKAIRCVKDAVVQITRQRDETNSAEIKAKLLALDKQLGPTRHKLQHVWDVVIQGNVAEVETAAKRAVVAIEQNDADFKHLLRQFPNNRHVARQYARFLGQVTGEPAAAAEMWEIAAKLSRGVAVRGDLAHELGLETFPNIPDRLQGNAVITETVGSSRGLPLDEVETADEQKVSLGERIASAPVESVSRARAAVALLALVLAAAVIAMLVWGTWFAGGLESEATALVPFVQMRMTALQIPAYGLRAVGEHLGVWAAAAPAAILPVSLGRSWNTTIQLRHLVGLSVAAVQMTSLLWLIGRNSERIEEAQRRFFGETRSYPYYDSPELITWVPTTISGALTMVALQQETVSLDENYTAQIVNTTTVLNAITNGGRIDTDIGETLDILLADIEAIRESVALVGGIILAAAGVVIVGGAIGMLVMVARLVRTDKQRTYRCLAALPKSTVSELVDALRAGKKDRHSDDEDEITSKDLTKHEESVLKVLNTGGESANMLSDVTFFSIGIALVVVAVAGCGAEIYIALVAEAEALRRDAPHLIAIPKAYAHELAALYSLHILAMNRSQPRLHVLSESEVVGQVSSYIATSREAYYLSSYGGDEMWQHPFDEWHDYVAEARRIVNCETDYAQGGVSFSHAYYCFPPDLAYVSFEPFMSSQIWETDKDTLSGLWRLLESPMYDLFFIPMYESIVPSIQKAIREANDQALTIVIVLLIVMLIIVAVVAVEIGKVTVHIRSVLKLLLHCPPVVVMQTPAIVSVLCGEGGRRGETTRESGRAGEFFEPVFLRLPDATLCTDDARVVKKANFSSARLFEEDLTGRNFIDFLRSEKFSGDVDAVLNAPDGQPGTLVFHRHDGQDTHLGVKIVDMGTEFVVSCRDVTESFRCNELIAEERKRSDELLKTILPESLVPKVQAGEENICFSVESATILFLDIVSFTPWCGRLPAQTVMATLNDMFKRLDERLGRKPTMTKIKCIGDCYMAAGGIFNTGSAQDHAIEVVTFGLEAIEAMRELNAARGESLEIRVGINTGGPIVAGVLGIGKPTFEILGPAINMAQQMEHHGQPMKVHMSEATYARLPAGRFQTVEHRVTVRGAEVKSYLTSERCA
jgi:class 3 adenylate cyclase